MEIIVKTKLGTQDVSVIMLKRLNDGSSKIFIVRGVR